MNYHYYLTILNMESGIIGVLWDSSTSCTPTLSTAVTDNQNVHFSRQCALECHGCVDDYGRMYPLFIILDAPQLQNLKKSYRISPTKHSQRFRSRMETTWCQNTEKMAVRRNLLLYESRIYYTRPF